jgi:pyruvate kinase
VDTEAKCIIVFSESGYTARMMSRYRSDVPVIALTGNYKTQRRMNLYWGTTPFMFKEKIVIHISLDQLEHYLKDLGIVNEGDNIVIIAGSTLEEGGTNMFRLHRVGK